jgi:hypothetical protein
MRRKWYIIAPLALVGGALFVALGGEVVRQLWNWLLPSLFGWPELTFWQALGLLALSRILFGGFGCHSGGGRFRRREHISPEARERFRQGIRDRFGCGPTPDPGGD